MLLTIVLIVVELNRRIRSMLDPRWRVRHQRSQLSDEMNSEAGIGGSLFRSHSPAAHDAGRQVGYGSSVAGQDRAGWGTASTAATALPARLTRGEHSLELGAVGSCCSAGACQPRMGRLSARSDGTVNEKAVQHVNSDPKGVQNQRNKMLPVLKKGSAGTR